MNHVKVFENVFDAKFCKKLIKKFNKSSKIVEGVVSTEEVESYRADEFLVSKDVHMGEHKEWEKLNRAYHDQISKVVLQYLEDYKHIIYDRCILHLDNAIMSRYEKHSGKFNIHQDAVGNSYLRSLTIITYLNHVSEGGETRFHNFDLDIKPELGSVLIFPSDFIHVHEGRVPVSNDKYLVVSFASIHVGVPELVEKALKSLK